MSRKRAIKRTSRAPKAARPPAGRTSAKRKAAKGATKKRAKVKRATAVTKRAGAKKRATTGRSASRGPAGKRTTTRPKSSKKTARPKLRLVPPPAEHGGKPVRTTRRPMPKLRAVAGTAGAERRESMFEPASKQRVLFKLMRTRAQTLSVLHNLGARDAERPIAKGKWCVREIVLHIALRDRARLEEIETALRGAPYSWTGYTLKDWKRQNAKEMPTVSHLSWAEALDLLRATREELIESLESVPDEPADVWGEAHAFGSMLMGLPPHDEHHADQVRRWREKQGL